MSFDISLNGNSKKGLILFAHGARDPRWAAPFQRLQQMTQAQITNVYVELAFLEFMTPSLPDLVDTLLKKGVTEITVSPIFLGQGGHVLRDLPEMINTIKDKYPELVLSQVTAVGESEMVLKAISQYCIETI